MIKLLNHYGFIEPSLGVLKEGFAVRKKGSVVVQVCENINVKKLNIQLHRTSYDWTQSCIQIQINHALTYELRVQNIGLKDFSLELKDISKHKNLEISFTVFPQGLFKYIHKTFLGKSKSLVRDSILINKLYLDENKVINYNDSNRFAYGENQKQKQIPVRILGFFGQTFGLAEAARRTFTSLEKSGLPITATQIPYTGKHQGSDHSIKVDKKFPTNTDEIRIFHFNGDHFDKLIADWGKGILDCRYKIGFWHWELPTFPNDYLPWFDIVDEIWVPSRFVFDAIAPKSPKPVQIIPLSLDELLHNPPAANRDIFGIPKSKLVFLITFDFYSIMERKNPISAIKAFSKLLEQDEHKNGTHLVVKVSNAHADPEGYKLLQEAIFLIDSEKITFINKVLARKDMLQLMNSCDALISLHRSEGFGLHLSEAMLMGKIVTATNWSGNTDFMDYENSFPINYKLIKLEKNIGPYIKGVPWAEPCVDHTISSLMYVVNKSNSQKITNIKRKAKETVIKQHSPHKIGKLIRERLNYININL